MTFAAPTNATGNLLSWKVPVGGDVWRHEKLVRGDVGRSGWCLLTLSYPSPLVEGPEPQGGEFKYDYLLRTSGQHFLLVSSHADLVTALIDVIGIRHKVSTPRVNVRQLVEDLVKQPQHYSLSGVYARVDGFGQSLRSMSLFGADLGEAQLFSSILPHLAPHRANLRDLRLRQEAVSISSKGELGFHYGGARSLRRTDSVLSFLASGGYLKWGD